MIQEYIQVLHGILVPDKVQVKIQSEVEGQEIFVTPTIIISMLEKYLAGAVNEEQLSDWAGFLISNDVYVTESWEDDFQADKYEPMWEVLQQLSAPVIDGETTKYRVEDYISQLSSLDSDR